MSTIARYGRVDLLCIDELGYMDLDKHGTEPLFQVLREREEKNCVAIASHEAFGKAHTGEAVPGSAETSRVPAGTRMLHDRTMLVELVKVAKFPWSPWLAQVRTPFGGTAVRWCGDQAVKPGMYHVEWTVDEDIAWGRNAKPAVGVGPGVRPGGHCVVLRGRLDLTVDGAAVLDFDGSQILLDLADALPEGVAGTWVELFIEREKIALYPYEL